MSDTDQRMVLRTVFLPPDLDEELRVKAFHGNVSKNDIIRQALVTALYGTRSSPPNVSKSKVVVKVSSTSKAKSTQAKKGAAIKYGHAKASGKVANRAISRTAKAKA